MSQRLFLTVGTACLLSGLRVLPGWAAPTNAVAALAAECKTLTSADFSGILDAPTHLVDVKLVDAAGDVPAHCRVLGYVTPNVGIGLVLPTLNWNGKLLEVGCGGYCGIAPEALL